MTEIAIAASGLLADLMSGRFIGLADFHVAQRLALHAREHAELPKVALALTMRELRNGSVCLELDSIDQLAPENDIGPESDPVEIHWPSVQQWQDALKDSPLLSHGELAVGDRPLRLVGNRLYLERYWQTERAVEKRLTELRNGKPLAAAPVARNGHEAAGTDLNEEQQQAVQMVAHHRISVVTGGPGTGKTHTVAGILRTYPEIGLVALAAPTGKAAARLQESVASKLAGELPVPDSSTLHRLLGIHPARPYEARFNASSPLPHDLVIIDETSMVPLTTMRLLLDALRPGTRAVFLGDPDQLASVDAGAVLADLVNSDRLLGDGAVTRLEKNYRSVTQIAKVADAIRLGDESECFSALASSDHVKLVDADATGGMDALPGLGDRMLDWASKLRQSAQDGDAERAGEIMAQHRLLCAHREGPYGVSRWNYHCKRWLAERLPRFGGEAGWYLGQPLLITTNSTAFTRTQVYNGDTGVVIASGGSLRAAIERASEPLLVAPQLLEGVTDLFAMTIHKSQGSEFDDVSIVLPQSDSPLLTRELIYTAVTRAKKSVTIYGTEDSLKTAIRTPARRASGLAG